MKILRAFIKKEFLQIVRDPSSILIAFILPTLLSLIYMYGINMDSVNISLGLKLDDANPRVTTLARSFSNNRYLQTQIYDSRDAMYSDIVNSKLQGAVVVPNDFTVNLNNGRPAQILVITDGSETNTANYVQLYASGVIAQWLATLGHTSQQPGLIEPQLLPICLVQREGGQSLLYPARLFGGNNQLSRYPFNGACCRPRMGTGHDGSFAEHTPQPAAVCRR